MSAPQTPPARGSATVEALPFILLNGLLFGSSLVVSRFSLGQWKPLNFVSSRITIAALSCIAVYLVSSNRRFPRDVRFWLRVSVWGVFGTAITISFVVSSLQYQSSGLTSLLVATNPAMVIIMAHFVLPEERLTRRTATGAVLAFLGVGLLIFSGETGLRNVRFDWRGPPLVIIGIISGAGSLVYARHALRTYDFFDVATGRFVTALPVVWLSMAMIEQIDVSTCDLRV